MDIFHLVCCKIKFIHLVPNDFRLVAGQWSPNKSEILKFSVTSKGCLVAAILLVLDASGYVKICQPESRRIVDAILRKELAECRKLFLM